MENNKDKMTFWDKLIGNEGIKTDVHVSLTSSSYIKLGGVLIIGVAIGNYVGNLLSK